MKEIGDVLELRDVVLPVAAVFNQEREDVIEFPAGVSRVQLGQLIVDDAPRGHLLLGVLHPRDLRPAAM